MRPSEPDLAPGAHDRRAKAPARELRVRAVVALTAAMMVAEIAVGSATGSMALLADGWHMATHVGALALAAFAYAIARRYARHDAFAFGTGKVPTLAGLVSAVSLGLVAVAMVVDSALRLLQPRDIDFVTSLPVAVVGLVVNLLSFGLLDDREHGHRHGHHDHDEHQHPHHHDHDHDHNHRAVLAHVLADALTSALAIVALASGRQWGWTWLDAATGIVGGLVILKWSFELGRHASSELVDVVPSRTVVRDVRRLLEELPGVRVTALHLWPLGGGRVGCTVVMAAPRPLAPNTYRAALDPLGLAHLAVEVHEQSADVSPSIRELE